MAAAMVATATIKSAELAGTAAAMASAGYVGGL